MDKPPKDPEKEKLTQLQSKSLQNAHKTAVEKIKTRYPNLSDFCQHYSPKVWSRFLANPKVAYTANYPRLSQLNEAYDSATAAEQWVDFCITALYAASSSRDTGMADGIHLFARNFAAQVMNYKTSELMLFFGRYNSGRYQTGYAAFDTTRIGHCFFHEFLKERKEELYAFTKQQKETDETPRKMYPNAVTREEFEKMTHIPVTISFNPLCTAEQRRCIINRYALTAASDAHDNLVYHALLLKAEQPAFDDLRMRHFFSIMD